MFFLSLQAFLLKNVLFNRESSDWRQMSGRNSKDNSKPLFYIIVRLIFKSGCSLLKLLAILSVCASKGFENPGFRLGAHDIGWLVNP